MNFFGNQQRALPAGAWFGQLARKTSNGSDVQANAQLKLLNTKAKSCCRHPENNGKGSRPFPNGPLCSGVHRCWGCWSRQ